MLPRCILPGRTYLLTRRCLDRRFYLRPSRSTNAIVRYVVGRAASFANFRIHGLVFMSNHMHIVGTDVEATLPEFMRELIRELSKGVGASIGRWEGFWGRTRSYSAVELLDPESVLEKLAYTLANPVSAHLVERADQWPGVTSAKMRWGQTVVAERPTTKYFAKSPQPKTQTIELHPPPGWSAREGERALFERVEAIERDTSAELARSKHGVLGVENILAQDPHDEPSSWEKRRGLDPTFASRDRWARVEAAQRNSDWHDTYKEAQQKRAAGDPKVIFPAGTWAMCRYFGYESERPTIPTPKEEPTEAA